MTAFGQQKRQVPKPELVGPHQSANPMFAQPPEWTPFRTRVLSFTALGLALIALGYLIYGPLFSIRTVTVSGTRLLNPTSITKASQKYLASQRWLVFPNRTIWILSSRGLAQHLEQQIRQRISVESVKVEKHAPHSIHIVVAERTPVATWTDGHSFGSVDKQGKIIELRSVADSTLPVLHDENEKMFTVDTSVVKPEVIASLQQLAGYMKQANIQVKEYLVPMIVCPTPIVQAPETTTNVNSSFNSKTTNLNLNANTAVNANLDIPISLPCDREALRFSSQEIHAQLTDGSRVLFDRHSDLNQAVQALKRVLSERSDKVYTSIDVRFGDRVYVK